MTDIYLIERTLPSIGDAVSLEVLLAIAREMIPSDAQLWLKLDDRIGDFFKEHPAVSRILKLAEEPPETAKVILSIQDHSQCPSITSLSNNGRVSANRLFCQAAEINGKEVRYDGRAPRLYYSAGELEHIDFIRRSIRPRKIAVQVKGGHWWKTYPYIEHLVAMLMKLENVVVFLTHDGDIPFKIQSGVMPLIALPYRELMLWLGAMDLIVGLDSGISHVGGAIGTRTHAIFGPTDPQEILGMFGSHVTWSRLPRSVRKRCQGKRCWMNPCKHLLCLKTLNPKVIARDVKRILTENYVNPRLAEEPTIIAEPELVISLPSPPQVVPTQQPSEIAIMRLDGLGGTVTLSDHAKKWYQKTGEKVVLVTRGYEVFFEGSPYVERVINVGMRNWQECSLVMRNQFDTLAEIRFALGKMYSQNGRVEQDFKKFDKLFTQFPIDFKQLEKFGLHHVQLTNKTLGLPFDTIDMEIFADEEFDIGNKPFILINNGVDVIHGTMRQTKCWDGWDGLVALMDTQVVQVGTLNDRRVKGAVDIRGQTSIKQLIYLIKKAERIVVTEGGIMHLAQAAGNPNVVVIGGPTQGPLFEYPDHKWVTSYICGNCWSTTHDWYERCPKDTDAVCMSTISPEMVAEVL